MLLHYLVKFENPKKYCGFVAQQAVQQIHNKTEQMELEHKVIEQCAVWLKLHCNVLCSANTKQALPLVRRGDRTSKPIIIIL